jgi:hypothetical protein
LDNKTRERRRNWGRRMGKAKEMPFWPPKTIKEKTLNEIVKYSF